MTLNFIKKINTDVITNPQNITFFLLILLLILVFAWSLPFLTVFPSVWPLYSDKYNYSNMFFLFYKLFILFNLFFFFYFDIELFDSNCFECSTSRFKPFVKVRS